MKKSKKIVSLVVLLILISSQTIYASDSVDVLKNLKDIADEYNATVTTIDSKEAKDRTFIVVNNVEEVNDLIKGVKAKMHENFSYETKTKKETVNTRGIPSAEVEYGNKTHTIKKWGIWKWYLNGTTAQVGGFRNITFACKYKKITSPISGNVYYKFEEIKNRDIKSSLTGVTPGVSWTHDVGVANFEKDNTVAKLEVSGTLEIGIEYDGNNYGIDIGDTWNMECTIDDVID
ncbi:hypothetical protein HZI73_00050 [Vallitalea pronyensis]|uniref:Uncharacterized protein n=1 Tax=Vallitalea pronyensis TaxID=1348613 RepID=A0A8J8MFZ6_9FIRM|nr:hypothetical protein [Vallitalea pronyensis]QUI20797.1 hypothetical protein HZI73_00050 [Vallitalea pronyensis]